jgi:hypothetical protein
MKEFVSIFTIGISAITAYMYYENKYNDITTTKSTIDGRSYLVRNKEDKEEAANKLATIRLNMIKLCDHLQATQKDDSRVSLLIERFNPDNLLEKPKGSKHTAYSVNKGEKIVLCLRDKKTDELIKLNTLMFVSLHELAHVMTKSIGHTDEFWDNFRYLLKEAIKINIFEHIDYSKEPEPYCGINITDTPLQM